MNIVKSYSTKRLSGGQVARNVLLEAKKERGFLAFFIVSFDPSTSSSSEEEEQQNGGSGDFSEDKSLSKKEFSSSNCSSVL